MAFPTYDHDSDCPPDWGKPKNKREGLAKIAKALGAPVVPKGPRGPEMPREPKTKSFVD